MLGDKVSADRLMFAALDRDTRGTPIASEGAEAIKRYSVKMLH